MADSPIRTNVPPFPPGWERWAKSSTEPGVFCRHPEHAPSDYADYDWKRPEDAKAGNKADWVRKRYCGRCVPRTSGGLTP